MELNRKNRTKYTFSIILELETIPPEDINDSCFYNPACDIEALDEAKKYVEICRTKFLPKMRKKGVKKDHIFNIQYWIDLRDGKLFGLYEATYIKGA